ncbi:Aspartate aminotransferase, cytoplasmic [Podochytrium sp. JEL0797]|nr:Aspartate aminotransferase, cytoplasmic [Podochytrium sp. JEL0797]
MLRSDCIPRSPEFVQKKNHQRHNPQRHRAMSPTQKSPKSANSASADTHVNKKPKTEQETDWVNLTQMPEDPIFKLLNECIADPSPDKINLSIGAYRDETGKPWVLPVVKKAKQVLLNDPNANHEYFGLEGNVSFNEASARLILGATSPAIGAKRYTAVQTVSGTGANRLAAEFFAKFRPATVYITNPTWGESLFAFQKCHKLIALFQGNHPKIFGAAHLPVIEYQYWNPKTRSLNYPVLLSTLRTAPRGSIFVLHACAHNPTGLDPTHAQWKEIASIMKQKSHFPFFDCAYQGFASGDLDRDAWAVRYFVEQGFEMLCAQSFSKNFGLYSERAGCLTGVFNNADTAMRAKSQFCALVRCSISNAPGFGAKVVDIVLKDEKLTEEWKDNLRTMANRITLMRQKVYNHLVELKTPGNWTHVTSQIGMFSYTGLTVKQVAAIKSKFHVYMTDEGRISMAGLNESNVERFAEAVDWVVRNA